MPIPKRTFIAAALALVMAVTGCSEKRIRRANVEEVEKGMAKKQVESILGQPTAETRDSVSKATGYVYRQGKDTVTIVFRDDKVQSIQSTLSE
jgi:outer membrane protein assembly factor BamE (lipoprotein component of BamABCDE complex)